MALAPPRGYKGALEGRIQRPDDLIPTSTIHETLTRNMERELDRRKIKQTAHLYGKAPANGAAYDRSEPPATIPAMPKIDTANQPLIRAIMSEISLPSLKGGEGSGQDVSFTQLPPFSVEAMKPYEAELKPDSKLRQAIQEARATLWAVSTASAPSELASEVAEVRRKLGVDLSIMRDRYGRPAGGATETAFKNRIFEEEKSMSRIIARLEDVLENLKAAGEEKDMAPKRWQANYAYVLARFQAQLAFLEEYQGLLGAMRKEYPTPYDPAVHTGYRMAAKEKAGDSAGKKYDKAARGLYEKSAKSYRGTPWEVLAKREKLTALGLEWQAY
jgi:hypothetical protein